MINCRIQLKSYQKNLGIYPFTSSAIREVPPPSPWSTCTHCRGSLWLPLRKVQALLSTPCQLLLDSSNTHPLITSSLDGTLGFGTRTWMKWTGVLAQCTCQEPTQPALATQESPTTPCQWGPKIWSLQITLLLAPTTHSSQPAWQEPHPTHLARGHYTDQWRGTQVSHLIYTLSMNQIQCHSLFTAPNSYKLPPLIGPTVEGGKRAAPIYSMVGRSKIGGFSEDLQKVRLPLTIFFLCIIYLKSMTERKRDETLGSLSKLGLVAAWGIRGYWPANEIDLPQVTGDQRWVDRGLWLCFRDLHGSKYLNVQIQRRHTHNLAERHPKEMEMGASAIMFWISEFICSQSYWGTLFWWTNVFSNQSTWVLRPLDHCFLNMPFVCTTVNDGQETWYLQIF